MKPARKLRKHERPLTKMELRVLDAVKRISNEKDEEGSTKRATRKEVGKLMRLTDDPHSHKTRSILVRLAHEGFLKINGKRRASFYTISKNGR